VVSHTMSANGPATATDRATPIVSCAKAARTLSTTPEQCVQRGTLDPSSDEIAAIVAETDALPSKGEALEPHAICRAAPGRNRFELDDGVSARNVQLCDANGRSSHLARDLRRRCFGDRRRGSNQQCKKNGAR
jgi:hypothetical protein